MTSYSKMGKAKETMSEEEALKQLTQTERKHVADMLFAYTARKSVSKLARKELEEVPGPSLSTTIGHLRSIAERTRGLGELRALPTQVLSWENPAQTISVMLLYTCVCLHPHLLACIPLAAILLGVFIPNYARKYPLSEENLPAPQYFNEFDDQQDQNQLVLERKHEAAERDIIRALREAQISIAKLCEGLEKFDKFKAGTGNFEIPGASCALYLVLLFALLNTAYLTSFVDVTQLFISTGWLVITLVHPSVKAYLAKLEPVQLNLTLVSRIVKVMTNQFEFNDPPITREVEIFELQKQGLTRRMWDTVMFTPYVYAPTSPYRLSHQYPPGDTCLSDICPPVDWCFREGDIWAEDPNSDGWIAERRVNGLEADGAWAYDVDGEWRRRRLIKVCFYTPE